MKFFIITVKITQINPRQVLKEIHFCGIPVWRMVADRHLTKERQL